MPFDLMNFQRSSQVLQKKYPGYTKNQYSQKTVKFLYPTGLVLD